MSVDRLVVRADGSAELGLGHIMRTLAVAERAQAAGLRVVYLCQRDAAVERLLTERSMAFATVNDRDWPGRVEPTDAVLVDATTSETALQTCRAKAAVVAVVDDSGLVDAPVDLIVAPDIDDVPPGFSTPMLVGWDHALIRSEFHRRSSRADERGTELLATFGGTDPTNAASAFVESLPSDVPFDRVTIVEGPGARPTTVGNADVRVVRDPDDLVERFRSATAVVTAAGTTMLELAALGRPMAVTAVVEEQRSAALKMVSAGALALDLTARPGSADSTPSVVRALGDPTRRSAIASGVNRLVDGKGATRVFDAMLELVHR